MADFFEKLTGAEKIDYNPVAIKEDTRKGSVLEEQEEGQLAVDVFQTDNEIIIQSTIAGVESEDLDITIQNDTVFIKGERKKKEEFEVQNYFYQECYWGPFSRSIILPEEIKAEDGRAELKNGILTIYLPKAEKVRIKKIKVNQLDKK